MNKVSVVEVGIMALSRRFQWVIASYLQMRSKAEQGITVKCLVGVPKPVALESWYMFNNAHQHNNITSIK